MRICLCVAVLGAASLLAQTPNFSGVWKANLEKSKMSGPAPSSILAIVDQKDSKLTVNIGAVGVHGEERSSYTYTTDGKPSMNTWRGLPMRTESSWNGGTLTLSSKVAGPRRVDISETFTLSSDGNTLTLEMSMASGERKQQQTLVLEKQPDSAGDALRKPEITAGAKFKNVTTPLKDLPASRFIDAMRSFSMSLGADCNLCHVENKFEADDKPAKVTARKMIDMTRAINAANFGGQFRVRCYTCHKGQAEPQSAPAFN